MQRQFQAAFARQLSREIDGVKSSMSAAAAPEASEQRLTSSGHSARLIDRRGSSAPRGDCYAIQTFPVGQAGIKGRVGAITQMMPGDFVTHRDRDWVPGGLIAFSVGQTRGTLAFP